MGGMGTRTGRGLADAPYVYQKRTEGRSHQHQLHVVVQREATRCGTVVAALEGFVVREPTEEFDRQCHIDRDGGHLEDDTAQHDPPTFVGVRVVPGRDRCEGTADALDAQSYEISGDEHDGICGRV